MEALRPGVLSTHQVLELADMGLLTDHSLTAEDKNESAFDLHLSDKVYKMKGGIKGKDDSPYRSTLDRHSTDSSTIPAEGMLLDKETTFVVPIREILHLDRSSRIVGVATGKSSIGRLDVLTRLIADYSNCYDQLPVLSDRRFDSRVNIALYVEITPLTFPIRIYPNCSVNQLRLCKGDLELSRIPIKQLDLYGPVVVGEGGGLVSMEEDLSVNLETTRISDTHKAFAFRAISQKEYERREGHSDSRVIDLKYPIVKHDPVQYWTDESELDNNAFKIIPESFYIIRSLQRFKLPNDVCVYAQAMTETFGELRIHYAGFVHPCFGRDRDGGAPLIFEIRGHNVPTLLRNAEAMARLQFYRMSAAAENKPSYGEQELTLSTYFNPWGA